MNHKPAPHFRFFEHRNQPPIPMSIFLYRVAKFSGAAFALIAGALAIGMVGYHALEGLPWLDAFLNAAMLLGGMGPVNTLHTSAGKFFSGCYALFSGLVFISVAGLVFAPVIHRLLHRFHFDD
jgi:hypothetical protein